MSDPNDTPKGRLLAVFPHLQLAANMAKFQVPGAEVCLAVVAKKPDGSGQVVCTFAAEEFLKDLGELVEFEKAIEEEVAKQKQLVLPGFETDD